MYVKFLHLDPDPHFESGSGSATLCARQLNVAGNVVDPKLLLTDTI
jgi:hypothetical protein